MANLFDTGLKLYRLTIKRVRPLHRVTHRIVSATIIPLLQWRRSFLTMPDDPFWFRLELLTNRHEYETVALLRRKVRPGMTILDVGAHVGYYARRFAEMTGQDGRVVAVEPHPRTFDILQRNVARYPNVTPVRVAAAEQAGTAELHDYLMMSASGSLHYDQSMADLQRATTTATDVAPRLHQGFAASTFTVRTVSLDALLEKLGVGQVDLVKMDIEGAEMNALRGMQAVIARSPDLMLVMEYNPQALRAFGHVPQDALREVMAMGFSHVQVIQADGDLLDITDDAATLDALTERLMTGMDVVNLLVTR
jgi:FkbM family methyltransferase